MKRLILSITFLLVIFSMFSSCIYPHARLKKDISSDGQKILKVIYKSPKLFSFNMAYRDKKWSIVFSINDCKVTPFAIIDNRTFYYFSVVDNELNPLLENTIIFEEHKVKGQNYSGQSFAVFPSDRGFLIVYLKQYDFFYMEFDIKGNILINKKKFYSNEKYSDTKNKILSISYSKGKIYLFLVEEPENMYTDSWNINLIKQDINCGKKEICKNFIPNKDGWYFAKNMKVYFAGQLIYISWVNGNINVMNDKNPISSIHFAQCSYSDKQCANFKTIIETKKYYNTDIRFAKIGDELTLLINDDENIWLQKIGINGEPVNNVTKTDKKEKSTLLKYFTIDNDFPYQVICSPQ